MHNGQMNHHQKLEIWCTKFSYKLPFYRSNMNGWRTYAYMLMEPKTEVCVLHHFSTSKSSWLNVNMIEITKTDFLLCFYSGKWLFLDCLEASTRICKTSGNAGLLKGTVSVCFTKHLSYLKKHLMVIKDFLKFSNELLAVTRTKTCGIIHSNLSTSTFYYLLKGKQGKTQLIVKVCFAWLPLHFVV